MNLIIDSGNTRVKLVVFNHSQIIFHNSFSDLTIELLRSVIDQYPISKVIYSDTRGCDFIPFVNAFPQIKTFIELTHQLSLPICLVYKTPETLGKDRIAAAVGAHFLFPEKSVLIINIGTAITIDFINQDGVYQGGIISPGPELRFKALHHFTGKLPMVKPTDETLLAGYSTESSIQFGVQNGIVFEINGYIQRYQELNNNLKVILSGGYAEMFEQKIKSPIFVEKFLVPMGLNYILDFNIN